MDSTGEAKPSGQVVNHNSYRSCGLPLVQMVGLPLCYPWTKNLKIDKNQVKAALGVEVYHLPRWLGTPCAIHGPKISKLIKIK